MVFYSCLFVFGGGYIASRICNWAEDIGQFFNHLDPDTRKITRDLKNMKLKIINSAPSSLTKLARIITCCLNIHSSKKKIYIYMSFKN